MKIRCDMTSCKNKPELIWNFLNVCREHWEKLNQRSIERKLNKQMVKIN